MVVNNTLAIKRVRRRSVFKNASIKQKLRSAAGMRVERVCIPIIQTNVASKNAFGVPLRRARNVNHMPKPISGIASVSVIK